jgi:polyhydroxyalkanoate synthesis repressor PhaR
MSEPRVIKKYPNRRLYDTVESRYITLADVRRLVIERIEFTVVDKKSQQDITRSILLQVIAEQEHQSNPLMSREFMSQVIRSYGEAAQGVLGSYLEQSLRLFSAQQKELKERIKHATGIDSLESAGALAERNYQRWRVVQDDIFRTLMGVVSGARNRNEPTEADRTDHQPR